MIRMKTEAIDVCQRVLANPGKLRGDYLSLARTTLVRKYNYVESLPEKTPTEQFTVLHLIGDSILFAFHQW